MSTGNAWEPLNKGEAFRRDLMIELSRYWGETFVKPVERLRALGRIFGVAESLYIVMKFDSAPSWVKERVDELREQIISVLRKYDVDMDEVDRLENMVYEYAKLLARLL